MAWTFANDPGTSTAAQRRDAVRSLIGDVVSSNPLQTDEQIAFYLAQQGGGTTVRSIYRAAALACDAIAAWFSAQKPDSLKIGQTSVDYKSQAAAFAARASELRRQANSAGGGSIFFGGTSVAANQAQAENSDVVQPTSYQGQDAYPGTVPRLGTVEQEGV